MRIHHAVLAMTLASTVTLLAATSDTLNAHDHGVLKVASRQLVPNDSVHVVGEKFARRSSLVLFLTGLHGRIRLQEVRADTGGAFAAMLHIPSDVAPGSYRLIAIASDGDEVGTLDVSVVSARPVTSTTSHHENEMPSAVALTLSRARSPWVTGAAALVILLSLIGGALLLRPSATKTGTMTPIIAVAVMGLLASAIAGAPSGTPAKDAHADSAAVAAVVHRYHRALSDGDTVAALSLLASDAIILESGDLETRDEYRTHHLSADIAFARAVPSVHGPVRVAMRGDVAWAISTSKTQGAYRGRAIDSQGAELMVVTREQEGWKIRAIHWSSHATRPPR